MTNTGYLRPPVSEPVCYDASGQVITYGTRWNDGPPGDSYSVCTHPERFAPLVPIADALIAHLVATYQVECREDLAYASDLYPPVQDVVRALRLTPVRADAAPLTFVFTADPAIVVHAGLLTNFHFPSCGCDACDECWDGAAQSLEDTIFAVTDGRFGEAVAGVLRLAVQHSVNTDAADGFFQPPQRWGAANALVGWCRRQVPGVGQFCRRPGWGWRRISGQDSRLRARAARVQLRPFGGLWAPWPRRESSHD